MPRVAYYTGSPLIDEDEDELRRVAWKLRVAVRINARSREQGRPAIELFGKVSGNPCLGTFKTCGEALVFLQPNQDEVGQ